MPVADAAGPKAEAPPAVTTRADEPQPGGTAPTAPPLAARLSESHRTGRRRWLMWLAGRLIVHADTDEHLSADACFLSDAGGER
jgi:hypothetical protein